MCVFYCHIVSASKDFYGVAYLRFCVLLHPCSVYVQPSGFHIELQADLLQV